MDLRRIKELRVDHDLSQQNVAELLGCSREVYRRYENGTRDIPLWALIRLATFYHCSTDYLLGLTNRRHYGAVHPALRK